MTPSEPIEAISAVTLLTADMAASFAFYHALGFRVVVGGTDAEFTTFRAGGSTAVPNFVNVQLDPTHDPTARIWGRVIFWVDDVDAVHARAVAAGYVPEMAPSDAPWGERYFHLRDPDGHELSFAKPLRPV
jgi:catechol 2,3-dioxygenase-like lactoylglutathione lyase family enzyme